MAKADALAAGMEVRINQGNYLDHIAVVLDPKPIPDGGDDRAGVEHQRKIKLAIKGVHNADDSPFETWLLPRFVDIDSRSPVRWGEQGVPSVTFQGHATELTTLDGASILANAESITDPMDPALDRFRPDTGVVKRYISRVLPGGYTDTDYLLALRDQRDSNGYSPNVALVGETQSGKTMFVQVLAVLAAERDGMPKPYPVFTLSGSSGVTSYDIFGQTTAVIIDGREVLVWMEGLAAIASRAGGFLYLDEWNAVSPGQAVALHPLMDDRRQFVNTQKAVPDGHGGFSPEVVQASTKLWIISTINPGYKGTQTMAEATSNRFRWLPWDYDDATEKALIPSKTVRLIGDKLREAGRQRIVTVPVGTSVLQRLNSDCSQFGVEVAIWSFTALFPPAERPRVQAIVEEGGLLDLLTSEYPEALYKPGSATNADPVTVGSTWSAP